MGEKKKILFVGAEVLPFAATGGLGDVMGSLPAAIQAASGGDCDVRVALPLYASIKEEWRAQMSDPVVFYVDLGWRHQYCGVRSLVKDGVTYYFIDNEQYFKRDALYGEYDDGERFAYFCRAVLEMMPHVDFFPDVLHAHDWQAALTIVYLNHIYRQRTGYGYMRTVFTIHNIEYQGKYSMDLLEDLYGLPGSAYHDMQYDGCMNLMKGAIVCADRVTTVSPRYAREILTPTYSHGLWHVLLANQNKLSGILNGIDYVYYDPFKDPVLAAHYSERSIPNKLKNKIALQADLGLPQDKDVPMMAIISRLAGHKGLDLVREMMENLVANDNVQLVVLGKGESAFEDFFRYLESKYNNKVRALIQYDRDLARKVYAAADIFIMPSKSEPCGLSQMIASRYGAIPVVRETGGLYDSIKGYWEDENGELRGNGFTFANYVSDELAERTRAAIALWRDVDRRKKLVQKIMTTDFSWNSSASNYIELYQGL